MRAWLLCTLPLAAAVVGWTLVAGCGGDEFTFDPTTVGQGGSPGTGGAGGAMQCVDADDDGVTDCDGDCDDMDPSTYPGAAEICGDGADNDCDGTADPQSLCMGLGTYVSQGVGNDSNPGTQASPVATIGKGMTNSQMLANQPVYVAEGHYSEKVTMVEGVDLLGGHHCAMTDCTWQRDPASFDSAIFDTDLEGVLAGPTITRQTELSGFRIVGMDGDPGSSNAISAVTVDQGTPTIRDNTVAGGLVTACSGYCGNEAVVIVGPSNDMLGALIEDNRLEGGSSTNWCAALSIGGQAAAEVRGNLIRGGTGDWSRALIVGGQAGPPVLVEDNDIFAGGCNGSGNTTFGVFVGGFVDVTFNDNRINTDATMLGQCPTCNATFWCGGLESEGGTLTLTNNVILGFPDGRRSTAVFMGEAEAPIGSVTINGNVLDGVGPMPNLSSAGGTSAAIAFRSSYPMSLNAIVGRIRNNVLIGGRSLNRFGLYEDDSPGGRTCKPEALENNDFFFPTSTTMTNDSMWRLWNGTTPTLLTTIAQVNAQLVNGGQSMASANIATNCMLDATWHLGSGSPCINAGVSTQAPTTDMDGQARPQGNAIDIGADEAG